MALRDETFGDLKNLTFALIGREYDASSATYTRLKSLWNYSAKKAYRQTNYWERFLVIGDERKVENKNKIPRSEDGKDTIDTYLRIDKHSPEDRRGDDYRFVVDASGATLTSGKSTRSSSLVDLYDNPDGDSLYLQPNNNEDEPTAFVTYKKAFNPSFGDAGDTEAIPEELLPYMAHYTAYTWQRSVDQNASENNFSLSLKLVNSILEDELAKITDQNIFNSYIVKNIRTNNNQMSI